MLYRYGSPPTVQALADLMHEKLVQDAWQMYMADCSMGLLKAWSKAARDLPSWRDIISDKPKRETRSGGEILDEILRDALGGHDGDHTI